MLGFTFFQRLQEVTNLKDHQNIIDINNQRANKMGNGLAYLENSLALIGDKVVRDMEGLNAVINHNHDKVEMTLKVLQANVSKLHDNMIRGMNHLNVTMSHVKGQIKKDLEHLTTTINQRKEISQSLTSWKPWSSGGFPESEQSQGRL